MESRVKALRDAGSEALGHKLTQEAAGALVHVTKRAWAAWEMGSREISDTSIELFCLKTGLKYRPDLLKSDGTIERHEKLEQKKLAAPKDGQERRALQFLEVFNIETSGTILLNVRQIKLIEAHKTEGAIIGLVTGEKIHVAQGYNEMKGMVWDV